MPIGILQEMLLEMNPDDVCGLVKKFYAQVKVDTRKDFYLGISTSPENRVSVQMQRYGADVGGVLLKNIKHDMAAVLEAVWLLCLGRLTGQSNGFHRKINTSGGFDSSSYAIKFMKDGGVYMVAADRRAGGENLAEPIVCTFINLNGRSCVGDLDDTIKKV